MPENFKLTSLVAFQKKSDPLEHNTATNIYMEIIGVIDSLKYNILSITFKEVTLRWYNTCISFW